MSVDEYFSERGQVEYYGPDGAGEPDEPNAVQFVPTPYVWRDPVEIPPRRFLYGNHYIRRYATGTVATGGTGKTALTIAEALAMVTGRDLLGVRPDETGLAVWLWNLEDTRDEMERRLAAAMQFHGVEPDEVAGRLYLDSGRDQPLTIAQTGRDGVTICRPVVNAVIDALITRKIDVLTVDPFVSCHRISENDNGAVDAAVKEWAHVADAANCAIELPHHTRKLNGTEATVDSARGGQAFADGLRSLRVLDKMTAEEGERLGVDDPGFQFWCRLGKQNMVPPVEKREWYRLASVALANGDNVQAVTRWRPPNPFEGITRDHLHAVQAALASGDYRADEQAKQWAGYAVADVLGVDVGAGLKKGERSKLQNTNRAKVRGMLRTWVQNSAIRYETRPDEKRMDRRFMVPGEGWTE